MIQHNIKQLLSIYYNVKRFYSQKKDADISSIYDLMSDFQFNKVPKFFHIRMNTVYQEAENGLFSYQDYATFLLAEYLVDDSLKIENVTDAKYIKEFLNNFYSKEILEKSLKEINELQLREEKRRSNIFEPDILGDSILLTLFKNKFIGIPILIMFYDKMENRLNSFKKQNKTILKTICYIKQQLNN